MIHHRVGIPKDTHALTLAELLYLSQSALQPELRALVFLVFILPAQLKMLYHWMKLPFPPLVTVKYHAILYREVFPFDFLLNATE